MDRTETGAETNKAIVRRFLGAVAAGDSDDVRGMLLVADPRKVEIIGLVAEGDTVAAEVRSEFHFGDRVYANEYHDLFVLRDGQIIHGREYFDTGKVAAFFGPVEG
jgi:uncharacterized protein